MKQASIVDFWIFGGFWDQRCLEFRIWLKVDCCLAEGLAGVLCGIVERLLTVRIHNAAPLWWDTAECFWAAIPLQLHIGPWQLWQGKCHVSGCVVDPRNPKPRTLCLFLMFCLDLACRELHARFPGSMSHDFRFGAFFP